MSAARPAATRTLRWAPLAGLAVYAVVIAARFRTLSGDVYWNSDVATPLVVADGIVRGVVHPRIGVQQAAYTWLAVATHWLPGWLRWWQVLPALSVAASAFVLAWTVRRLAGGWAAAVALALGLCMPPLVLLDAVAPVFHGLAISGAILLDALLVGLGRGALLPWRGRLVAAAAVLALLAGVVTATDLTLAAIGVVPFLAAALALAWRHRGGASRRVAIAAIAVSAAAALVALATQLLMHRAGYSPGLPASAGGGGAVRLSAIPSHVHVLARGLADLGDGLPMHPGDAVQPVALAAAVMLVAATIAVALVVAVEEFRGAAEDAARFAHVVFWLVAAVALLAVFVAGNLVLGAGGDSPPSARLVSPERYLMPLWFAASGLVPLWPRTPLRQAATGGVVGAWCVLSAATVSTAATSHAFRPANTVGLEAVVTQLVERGLHHGYASYWDAYALSVQTGFTLRPLPAAEGIWCGMPAPVVCAHIDNGTYSWYTPQPGPSYVLVDPRIDFLQTPPPASFGMPSAVWQVGAFTVYVYPGDVVTRFAPACSGRADHRCV